MCSACAAVCLCSNTLVVDEVQEAHALCYGPDHHKVVSADGTLFKPNGTFTGACLSRRFDYLSACCRAREVPCSACRKRRSTCMKAHTCNIWRIVPWR